MEIYSNEKIYQNVCTFVCLCVCVCHKEYCLTWSGDFCENQDLENKIHYEPVFTKCYFLTLKICVNNENNIFI